MGNYRRIFAPPAHTHTHTHTHTKIEGRKIRAIKLVCKNFGVKKLGAKNNRAKKLGAKKLEDKNKLPSFNLTFNVLNLAFDLCLL